MLDIALDGPNGDEILDLLKRHQTGEIVAEQYLAPTGEVLDVSSHGSVPEGCLPVLELAAC